MSKKLFHARGQSHAARGIQAHIPDSAPTWAKVAYHFGYLCVMCARANRSIGQHINRMDADNFYSDPVEKFDSDKLRNDLAKVCGWRVFE